MFVREGNPNKHSYVVNKKLNGKLSTKFSEKGYFQMFLFIYKI
jgi:hypothetical protein